MKDEAPPQPAVLPAPTESAVDILVKHEEEEEELRRLALREKLKIKGIKPVRRLSSTDSLPPDLKEPKAEPESVADEPVSEVDSQPTEHIQEPGQTQEQEQPEQQILESELKPDSESPNATHEEVLEPCLPEI